MALLCSAVRDPALSDREVRRQVEARLNDIAAERADPARLAECSFFANCFTSQSRQSPPIHGDRDAVASLDGAAVRAFYRAYVGPRPVERAQRGYLPG